MYKHKNMSETTFWLLSLLWGDVLTLIGAITAAIFYLKGYSFYKHHYSYVCEVGDKWGGLTLGPFIFINHNPSKTLLNHEFGHSLQNCYFGDGMILISLWSAARYWFRELVSRQLYDVPAFLRPLKEFIHELGYELPTYDSIWFEGTATFLGNRFDTGRG